MFGHFSGRNVFILLFTVYVLLFNVKLFSVVRTAATRLRDTRHDDAVRDVIETGPAT